MEVWLDIDGVLHYSVIKDRLKKLYTFEVSFYQVLEDQSNIKVKYMIDSIIKMRENWMRLKKDFVIHQSSLISFKISDFVNRLEKFITDIDISFININQRDQEIIKDTGAPLLVFFFLYLTRVQSLIMKNDNSTKLKLMRLSLTIIWMVLKQATKNPLDELIKDKDMQKNFLNEFTVLIYHMRIKKTSNLI